MPKRLRKGASAGDDLPVLKMAGQKGKEIMMKEEYLVEAKETIRKEWGFAGELVIDCAADLNPVMGEMKMTEFLKNCTACGGNWGGMLLSGIQKLWPAVYDAIPEDMGLQAFSCICFTLMLCGVDTAE